MSAEATLAVMKHATGTDAEWRMLMLLAGEANRQGVVVGVSMAVLAERMDKSERGVAGVKSRLKASGQLEVLDEGGGRGRSAVYRIVLPGLETPQMPVDTPQPDSPQPDPAPGPGSIGSSTTSSSWGRGTTMAAKEREFYETVEGLVDTTPDAPIEGDGAMVLDGIELLRQGKKVDSKIVTSREMGIAAAALGAFNRCFEWQAPGAEHPKRRSDYGLGANLTSIVMRVRDRPSWDAAKHVRLVESAWRIRWWEKNGRSKRRPHPNVIWGGKSFDNVVQDAQDESAGESPAKIKKRRYTRG